MDKKDLAKLALRLYYDKGYSNKMLVNRILTNGNLDFVSWYPELKNDVETVQELARVADCLYIDLFSTEELLTRSFDFAIPDYEETERQKRLEAVIPGYSDISVDDLLELAQQINDGETPGETRPRDAMTDKLMELATIAKKYHDLETAYQQQNGPIYPTLLNDHPDIETDSETDGEPLPDFEQITPVEIAPTSSGIEFPKAQKPTSKRVVRVKVDHPSDKRFITGQQKQLNNNTRLWESDNNTDSELLKLYW